jgi:hypothetical protein
MEKSQMFVSLIILLCYASVFPSTKLLRLAITALTFGGYQLTRLSMQPVLNNAVAIVEDNEDAAATVEDKGDSLEDKGLVLPKGTLLGVKEGTVVAPKNKR